MRREARRPHEKWEAGDTHFDGLPNAVTSGGSLNVILRVPVTIIDDDCVCRLQVDTKPACSSREQEEEFAAIGRIEAIDAVLSLVVRCVAIDTAVIEVLRDQVVLDDVQHTRHLAEQ